MKLSTDALALRLIVETIGASYRKTVSVIVLLPKAYRLLRDFFFSFITTILRRTVLRALTFW